MCDYRDDDDNDDDDDNNINRNESDDRFVLDTRFVYGLHDDGYTRSRLGNLTVIPYEPS